MSRRTSLATPDELRSALELRSADQTTPKIPLNNPNSIFHLKDIFHVAHPSSLVCDSSDSEDVLFLLPIYI